MHHEKSSACEHTHRYATHSASAERRARVVTAITAAMMVVEIMAGLGFNSMALLADGWHMSTHVTAFVITALAYYFSRRHAADHRYSFGTGKMRVLGGFVSAVLLAVVALLMAGESMHRFFEPLPIRFNEAILIASLGLLVNLACARVLQDHSHPHGGHHHHDLNLKSAYIHVLADALTSVTAIVALCSGKYFGWNWLDPVMGLVGSVIVSIWAYTLIRDTSGILLDRTPDSTDLPAEIRRAVERDGDAILTDLHIWQIGEEQYAAIVSLSARHPKSVEAYRQLIAVHEELVHLTIEVHQQEEAKS
jgi:cation diffusion facilitator family transporter